ncbi:MAG: hypothetical protein IT210_22500 [Armatimonadetes bacterium]|nr:hypothetical protein [Armatimonadota bacterium]
MLAISAEDIKDILFIPAEEAAYDAAITAHIARSQLAVEYRIAGDYLLDASAPGLQALLRLGVMEVLAGEFAEQAASEEGSVEAFQIASIRIGERSPDPAGLRTRGWERLAPFLKPPPADLLSSTLTLPRRLGLDEDSGLP